MSIVNPPIDSPDIAGSLGPSVFSQPASVSSDTTLNPIPNINPISSISSVPLNSSVPPVGGIPTIPQAANATWAGAQDLRVKIRVPSEYLSSSLTTGPNGELTNNGGILFPYTPTINLDNRAEFSTQNPTHSNFSQHFFRHSSVGPLQVTGKFTVQNETEGAVLLSIIHLLRALTKMRFGDDPQAGSPPPVCRFDGYGDYMMYNVPVSITGWKLELPDSVDYISVGKNIKTFGNSMVPVYSTLSIDMNIMYSRAEMLAHNVPSWLQGKLAGKGYL